MGLQISLLGAPRVLRDGETVSFDTRKATALLAHLALAERPRSREALCDLLWSGQDPDHARSALRRTLSTLRKGIGEDRIDATGDSLALARAGDVDVDVFRFRELAARADDVEDLAAAVGCFGGDLLEGFSVRGDSEFDAWVTAEADLLRRELATTLGRLVEALARDGDFARAIPYARRWLELDPLHEAAHRELIRLYAWSGDRAAALDQYRTCVRLLSQELGVAPLDETAALFERVSDGVLEPPAPAPATVAAPRVAVPARPAAFPLVGREAEVEVLRSAYERAASSGRVVVLEGEGGIGKTRLAEELAAAAAAAGGVVLTARCHEDETALPYAPLAQLVTGALPRAAAWAPGLPAQRLADASLIVPELAGVGDDVPAPLSLSGPGAQTRLIEALTAVLVAACGGDAPGVLVVDDAHAADQASLDVLAYLVRRLRDRPLVVVLTWRGEAVGPGHRLRALAGDAAREGTADVLVLARLDADDVHELTQRVLGADATEDTGTRAAAESEGLPLFAVEYLAAVAGGVEPAPEDLSAGLRSVLEARLGGTGEVCRQVLGAAAVLGRSFDLDVVRGVSGRSEAEAVDALEELTARGLLRDAHAGDQEHEFSHDRFRAIVLDDVSLARRRLLHRRAAAELERTGARPAVLAQHLRAAGDDASAAVQHARAAADATAVAAHREALEHLEAALALGHPDAAALQERVGDARTLLGDYPGALEAYEDAAARTDGVARARMEHRLAGVHARRGDWGRCAARLDQALAGAEEDATLRARILADLALALHHAGDAPRAAELAAAALGDATGDPGARAQAHNVLGIVAHARGDLDGARRALEESLAAADAGDDTEARVAALNNLALVRREAGDLDGALDLTARALTLCAASGDRHREAALENNLADLHHAAGRAEESMTHLKRAVAIFAEVGGDQAAADPGIWQLTSW